MLQKINLFIVILDGSYLLEEHFETILEAYLEPILKHMKQQQIIIEKEDKDKKGEPEKNKITPKLKCGLVVFGNYEPISRSPVTTYYFEENLSQFEKLIAGIEFEDGGIRENAVAEGLVAALEMFDAHESQIKPEIPETIEIIKHCLLISNSHPRHDLVHRNIDEKYDQYSMKQIVEEMKNQKIRFSLITPEANFTELEELVSEVNQDVEVHNSTDVINSSHVVKLAGFKPLFTRPKEVTAQKRKREDSTSSTGTNDQQTSSTQSSGNEAKKVKLEPTQEPAKDQPPISSSQLPGQQSQPLQTLSSIDKDQVTVTQNPSGQQQSSNKPSVVNTPAQDTPKLQAPTVSNATTSNTNPTPPQSIQIPPNPLAQTQQPVKITNSAAPSNVTAAQAQFSAPTSSITTMPRPLQRPPFVARPQAKVPDLHAQLQAHLETMKPEQRKQYISNFPFLRNPQLRNVLAANPNLRNNTLLNTELAAAATRNLASALQLNHQINLGQTMLPLQNGVNIGQQQIANFVTSASPISEAVNTQALNGFVTTSQQLGFNASTAPTASTSNSASAVGYTTASTSGTIGTQFGANAQLPASTIMNSISAAGMSNAVTGQTTAGVIGQMPTSSMNGGIRPNNLPQKKVIALWSGHIAWVNNNQGQKRDNICQVAAFPISAKKAVPNAQTPQVDYMISRWPDKLEISGVIQSYKDLLTRAPNLKIVSFLPSPTPTQQDNSNIFGNLMRNLESRKMAAVVRFPNAPNPNGGIVLFTSNPPRLLGLLFLDTPLPPNAQIISQGQQIVRPPQATVQQTQALQQQQQLMQALRTQQQQQQQPVIPIQATVAALQQQQQQQKLLQQQQQIANLPPNVQQILQQQAAMQSAILQNPGNDFYRMQQQLQMQQRMQLLNPAGSNNNSALTPQQLQQLLLRQRQQSQQQSTQ